MALGNIMKGVISEKLPNDKFKVKISTLNREVICNVSEISKITKSYVRFLPGDIVRIEFFMNNFERGTIVGI